MQVDGTIFHTAMRPSGGTAAGGGGCLSKRKKKTSDVTHIVIGQNLNTSHATKACHSNKRLQAEGGTLV